MLPGRLRDRIDILVRVKANNALGRTEVWEVERSVWGRITLSAITTRMAYMQANQPTVTHHVLLRGEVPLSQADNRFRCNGKEYEVVATEGNVDDLGKFTKVEVNLILHGA